MVGFSLNLCYGIIVSADTMEEIKKVLTDKEYDEMMDNYARCINVLMGEDYFIGIVVKVLENDDVDFVYSTSSFATPSVDDEDLIDFKRFFNEHGLWKFIDWKPERLLINFCF